MGDWSMTALTPLIVAEELAEIRLVLGRQDKRPASLVAQKYFEHLTDISAPAFRAAVQTIIREDRYFPTISRIRQASAEWQTRHPIAVVRQIDETTCPQCRELYRPITHYAPKMVFGESPLHRPLYPELTPDARYVVLERKERYGCRCSPPSGWQPIDDEEPPCASLDTLLKYHAELLLRHGKARYDGGHLIGILPRVQAIA